MDRVTPDDVTTEDVTTEDPGPAGAQQPTRPPGKPSPLLSLPGAVAAPGMDEGVAWHYGDPIAEQRAAVRGAALFDLSHRGLLTVTGPDRLTWLNTLTSLLLSDLPDGAASAALVLSPAGHVEHHMGVTDLGGVSYLDTEPASAAALLDYLRSMVFWSKVELADGTAELAQLRLVGPQLASVVRAAGLLAEPPALGSAVPLAVGGFARTTTDGLDLFVARADVSRLAAGLIAAGGLPAGSWAADALRIESRTPRLGADTDDRTIPNEVNWLATAVHLSKGCYRGQETVARVANLGRPPRRLVLLHLDGSADRLPETGTAVTTAAGRTVGRVGTVAHHHEDGPIALALVKRSIPAGTPLLADGVDAAIDPDDIDADETTGPPLSVVDRRTFTDIRRR